MRKNILYVGLALLSIATQFVSAQELTTGYFNEGYLFRHEMNPAYANERNYVSIPALGGLNISMRGNLGVKDVLYNRNGRTVTFMNNAVSAQEFLGNIHDKNRFGVDSRIQLLGGGFKAFGGYNTIGLSVRQHSTVIIPGELFRLAKEGPANQTYDISDLKAHADAYLELAFGHSRQLTDQLRVGGKLKVLLGGANVDATFHTAQLELAEDGYKGIVDAEVQASVKGLSYITETEMRGPDKDHPHTYVNDVDVDGPGLNGFGLALDLGAEYRLNEDWAFNASVLDLGFIAWSNNLLASTNGLRTVNTNDYIFNVDDDATNSFDNELDNLSEGLATLYELQDMGDQGGRTRMLGATVHVGAEYTFPLYRNLTFGLMNTTRLMGSYSWTDFRLSANVAPIKVLSATASLSEGTNGLGFGWMLNVHPKGFNFFLGMDHLFGKLAKQGIPLAHQADLSLGFNVMF